MRLDDVVDTFARLDFPDRNEPGLPARETVLAARTAMERAVADDDFLLDCMALELGLIASGAPRNGLVPFLTLAGSGIRMAFGFWPPYGGPGAHEHTAWTITGVCRNELEVRTYDRAASYRSGALVDQNLFVAPAGKVGFIYEPGIHAPRNPTRDWSLSIHVISPRDGLPLPDHEDAPRELRPPAPSDGQPVHAYASVMAARQKQRWLRQLAQIAAASASPLAPAQLAACFDLGSTATRAYVEDLGGAAADGSSAAYLLRRVADGLVLRQQSTPGGSALAVETPGGLVCEIETGDIARAALSYAAGHELLDVAALPGALDDEERFALGMALEESGLFERVRTT
ncbi:hypothetical protein [Duganella violaceipulchra]|uniref:Uncharacterized protein n=1 Tax=Duganella violaceipulchra TaxID=2849652 RepID=A0AA41H837_9BURK|nr:hypothetical protein [Duganella violaceicalia]MBV6323823.1 hypothetical protein [Duganella violaceicalia]MCP2007514.1 hypothetical protein [Duganella violaceicalia]